MRVWSIAFPAAMLFICKLSHSLALYDRVAAFKWMSTRHFAFQSSYPPPSRPLSWKWLLPILSWNWPPAVQHWDLVKRKWNIQRYIIASEANFDTDIQAGVDTRIIRDCCSLTQTCEDWIRFCGIIIAHFAEVARMCLMFCSFPLESLNDCLILDTTTLCCLGRRYAYTLVTPTPQSESTNTLICREHQELVIKCEHLTPVETVY